MMFLVCFQIFEIDRVELEEFEEEYTVEEEVERSLQESLFVL